MAVPWSVWVHGVYGILTMIVEHSNVLGGAMRFVGCEMAPLCKTCRVSEVAKVSVSVLAGMLCVAIIDGQGTGSVVYQERCQVSGIKRTGRY